MDEDEMEAKFAELGGIVPVGGGAFAPMSQAELTEIEGLIGAPLPVAYRSFLAKYGASTFGRLVAFRPAADPPEWVSSTGDLNFDSFHGSGWSPGREVHSLRWNIENYAGRIPDGLIPIGTDGGGDRICLSVDGTGVGQVYYWDHNSEGAEDEEESDDEGGIGLDHFSTNLQLTFVCDSFDDFLRLLRPND